MLETSQLQTLIVAARAGSFSQAAQELHVTQSAVSQSIRNLEKRVGLPLFERQGRRLVLTSGGERLCRSGEKFLAGIKNVLDEIGDEQERPKGKVRIGTLNGIGKSWLAPELIQFSKKYRDITVNVKLGLRDELVKLFKEHFLDLVILPEDGLPNVGERHFFGGGTIRFYFSQNSWV